MVTIEAGFIVTPEKDIQISNIDKLKDDLNPGKCIAVMGAIAESIPHTRTQVRAAIASYLGN